MQRVSRLVLNKPWTMSTSSLVMMRSNKYHHLTALNHKLPLSSISQLNNKYFLSSKSYSSSSKEENNQKNETLNGSNAKEESTKTTNDHQQTDANPELESLKTKLSEKEKQVLQLQDAYRRSLADMENLRQRTRKEVESTSLFAIQKFAKELLDIADVLQMAIDSTPKEALNDNKPLQDLHQGVSLTRTELLKCFKRFGVESFESTGEKFDPNMHQALYRAPSKDFEPGVVMQTVKTGYTLNGRVLRPAQVGVVMDQ